MKLINEYVPKKSGDASIAKVIVAIAILASLKVWIVCFNGEVILMKSAHLLGTALAPFALIAGAAIVLWIPTYYLIQLKKAVVWVLDKR